MITGLTPLTKHRVLLFAIVYLLNLPLINFDI